MTKNCRYTIFISPKAVEHDIYTLSEAAAQNSDILDAQREGWRKVFATDDNRLVVMEKVGE